MNSETTLLQLVSRRESIGMPIAILSARSGVKEPTVKRILGGRAAQASFAHVAAVAEALGTPIGFAAVDPDQFRRAQARAKAEQIARMVQGTSALEGQAVDGVDYQRLIERTTNDLLRG
ncbi:MAG: hypothetical protein EBR07_12365, partial [Planctomycetes bacterium]|nr:hypothetical protein [Planctomycetota bacterium]